MEKDELNVHLAPYFEQVVDAIYLAEGGAMAKKPYGVLSVPCSGHEECRKVAYNTVRNNYYRWIKAGRPGEYLDFLQARYAPLKVANDPHDLNANWKRNVEALL